MKLRRPTDFLILEALAEHGRNIAPNLAHHTGKSRKNINTRLPILDDYGLVERVGPSAHSGLYKLTDDGRTVLELKHRSETDEEFWKLLNDEFTSPDRRVVYPADAVRQPTEQ